MAEIHDLDLLRQQIDELDNEILDVFERRLKVCRQIGNTKKASGAAILDSNREMAELEKVYNLAGFESRPYVRELFEFIMDVSKRHQAKPSFGVLGRSLPHTYSPEIHNIFDSSYTYSVIEREPEELDDLFTGKVYKGFNVTIPYKKEAAARCDVLDSAAQATGSVNTVVIGDDGKVYGYNTDYFGFMYMLRSKGIEVDGRKVLVLGSGGGASAIKYALQTLKAGEIRSCGRNSEINYDNVYDVCADVQVIVNCTPVGMFPNVNESPIDLSRFGKLEACCDIVYNPSRTKFLQDAKALGVKFCGGLGMLVAQAYKASRLFAGDVEGANNLGPADEEKIARCVKLMANKMLNITLIGMPGSGKTILCKNIAAVTGRKLVDLDIAYQEKYGVTAAQTLSTEGEEVFRERECSVAAEILPQSGLIISCGGGVVVRPENEFYVKCNSNVFYLERPLSALTDKNRPVSIMHGVEKLYSMRKDKYESWCDYKITYDRFDMKKEFLDEATEQIMGELSEGT